MAEPMVDIEAQAPPEATQTSEAATGHLQQRQLEAGEDQKLLSAEENKAHDQSLSDCEQFSVEQNRDGIAASEQAATPEMMPQSHPGQYPQASADQTSETGSSHADTITSQLEEQQPVEQASFTRSRALSPASVPSGHEQMQSYNTSSSSSSSMAVSSGASVSVTSTPSSIRAARDALNQSAQQLIEDINLKRQQDTQLMADYKKALELQVNKSVESLEQHMYSLYERQSSAIQDKLQQLFQTLERIDRIEEELQQFKQALGNLYQDVQPTS